MKKIKRFFGFLILIILIAAGAVVYAGYDKYKSALENKPLEEAVGEIHSIEHYTSLADIPKTFKDAAIAVEDRRFYYHNGVDIIGIARALAVDIKQKKMVEGGSTITQQLAKNMYFPMDKSPVRKLAEMFMAMRIEREYSKDEILELYFNGIYYGSGYYNIYDAAMGYFKKEPAKMSDYESTLLAGVPNAPSVYSPKSNKELALKRQEKVLKSMVDCGYISDEERDRIASDK